METPLISVIIAVYNGDRFIKAAIDSLIAQSYPNIEIIVLDDGSTDSTAQLAKSYDQVVYEHQENGGVASARNRALKIASGTYIAFLDSDDIYHPDKLKTQMDYLVTNKEVDGCMVYINNFLEPGHEQTSELEAYFSNKEKVSLTTVLAAKDIFSEVGDFNTSYKAGSDFEWMMRAKELHFRFDMLQETLLDRRVHDKNLTVTEQRKDKLMRFRILKESMERKREKQIGKQ